MSILGRTPYQGKRNNIRFIPAASFSAPSSKRTAASSPQISMA